MKLTIKAKIISGFAVMFVLSMALGGYSLYGMTRITRLSELAKGYESASSDISNVLAAHYSWRQNLTLAVLSDVEFTGSFNPDGCALGQWRASDVAREYADSTVTSLLNQIDGPHRTMHQQAEVVIGHIKAGNRALAQEIFQNQILPNATETINLLTQLGDYYETLMDDNMLNILAFERNTITVDIILLVIAALLSIFLAVFITKSITTPINQLVEVAQNVARGNLNVNINTSAQDETGVLARSFANVVENINALIDDLDKVSQANEAGDIEARIDAKLYKGSFSHVADGVNGIFGGLVTEVVELLGCLGEFGNGNFDADVPKKAGKKVIMNETVDALRNNLRSVNKEIGAMVNTVVDGNLSMRADAKAYKGDWALLVDGLNKLMDAVSAPNNEILDVMRNMAGGKFDLRMAGNYKGDFLTVKDSVNSTVENIASYIKEIAAVLGNISKNDLNQAITREYVGSFSAIKDALNDIIATLNSVIGDISSAAEQVNSGAKSISDSSMTLATGASEQAASVQELNATLISINESTAQNAKNAENAEVLSENSKSSAAKGDEDMKNMMVSMEAIKDATTKITNIIKTITDIAFQTNLLALNASVEAARAGDQGKGFAVVAEEVRNLASRSQAAAKETSELIDESINRVDEGTKIALQTADTLKVMVGDVSKVAEIIAGIATASREQSISVEQITQGLSQITNVVQNNSSTSEETASASQELSSQAEIMNNLVSVFKLKR